MKKLILFTVFLCFLLCGCGMKAADHIIRPSAVPEKKLTKTAVVPAAKETDPLLLLSDDPWERCAAAGNSESRPENVANIENDEFRRRVQITFLIQDADTQYAFIAERCMDGKVYVCRIDGKANCAERLNFSVEPNDAMRNFCSDPDMEGAGLSPVISGINSAYEWRCHEGKALITAQLAEADAAGFDKSIWFEIPQPEGEILIINNK